MSGLGRNDLSKDLPAVAAADPVIEAVSCTVVTERAAYDLRIPAPGRHMIYAAAMAAVVGERLGLSKEEIEAGVAHYEPAGERMRMLRHESGALLLSDCYNANPQSMAAAIETLGRSGCTHRIAVLGDMGELGAISRQAHYDAGALCAAQGVETVLAVGDKSAEIARGAAESGCADVRHFETREAACAVLEKLLGPDCAVLIKASHAMGFQAITARLTQKT